MTHDVIARDPSCVFCSIVSNTSEAAIVLDDDDAVAFLDRRPVFPGHVLVVPRDHHETLVDLPAASLGGLFLRVQQVARAVESALGADGTWISMNNRVSQSVPHLHVHVVPRRRKDGLKGFYWPRQSYADDNAMRTMAASINAAINTAISDS